MILRIVNPYLVAAILEPCLFLESDEAASIAAVDPEDEVAVRDLVRRLLVPYFLEFDEKSKALIRDSLGYMLLQGSNKWEALFAMNQCPLALPDPPRKFFEWLWDELFHANICLAGPIDEYVVKEDVHAPNLIRRGKPA